MTQLSLTEAASDLPDGFDYGAELITPAKEAELVAQFAELDFREFEFHGYLGKRRVVSFGFHYDFSEARVQRVADIPDFLLPLRDKAAAFARLRPAEFEHALVTEYMPGAAIGWHRDRPQFGKVVGISLGEPVTMRLRRRTATGFERRALPLPPRSIYLLDGEVRQEWEHSIVPVERPRRSITFRALR